MLFTMHCSILTRGCWLAVDPIAISGSGNENDIIQNKP